MSWCLLSHKKTVPQAHTDFPANQQEGNDLLGVFLLESQDDTRSLRDKLLTTQRAEQEPGLEQTT